MLSFVSHACRMACPLLPFRAGRLSHFSRSLDKCSHHCNDVRVRQQARSSIVVAGALAACMLASYYAPRVVGCRYQRSCHLKKSDSTRTKQNGQDQGFKVELASADEEEDAETWEEAMDEMEDPWMREPPGESFAELSENARAPAIGTVRKAVPVITADEFQKMSLQDDSDLLVVLDVRSEDEYRSGHLSAAQHVSLQGLSAGVADQWQSRTVVVVGSGDARSQQACTRLSQVFKIQSVFHLVPQAQL